MLKNPQALNVVSLRSHLKCAFSSIGAATSITSEILVFLGKLSAAITY
jgi:hypothetical protein